MYTRIYKKKILINLFSFIFYFEITLKKNKRFACIVLTHKKKSQPYNCDTTSSPRI